MDDDNNGFTDCEDFACQDRIVCAGEATNANCSDGKDNDGDTKIDCADEDCQSESIIVCNGSSPVSPLPDKSQWPALIKTACTNGIDDNSNGFTDCGDFDCRDNFEVVDCQDLPPEGNNATCSDGIDNDKDGKTDCEDGNCQGESIVVCNGNVPASPMPAQSEWTNLANTRCSDGADNDNNTHKDCDDFGCSWNAEVTVCGAPAVGAPQATRAAKRPTRARIAKVGFRDMKAPPKWGGSIARPRVGNSREQPPYHPETGAVSSLGHGVRVPTATPKRRRRHGSSTQRERIQRNRLSTVEFRGHETYFRGAKALRWSERCVSRGECGGGGARCGPPRRGRSRPGRTPRHSERRD